MDLALAQTTAQLFGSVLTLIPFAVASIFYLLYWLPLGATPSMTTLFFKCLPMLFLWFFVYRQGVNRSYNRRILGGLVFSCVGDALLVYHAYFVQGLLAFAVAHGLYSMAFGLRALRAKLGGILGVFALVAYSFFYSVLEGALVWLAAVYSLMLLLMVWAALGRASQFVNNRKRHFAWAGFWVGGALLFWLSDFVLAWNLFRSHVPWGNYIVMFTYYAAQLGISLSVIIPKKSKEV